MPSFYSNFDDYSDMTKLVMMMTISFVINTRSVCGHIYIMGDKNFLVEVWEYFLKRKRYLTVAQ